MSEPAADHRRMTAERRVEGVLDPAESRLARDATASTPAVAREPGVSRVTVYAHVPTREALLEGVVEPIVRHTGEAVKAAELHEGTAVDAIERRIAVARSATDRNSAVGGGERG